MQIRQGWQNVWQKLFTWLWTRKQRKVETRSGHKLQRLAPPTYVCQPVPISERLHILSEYHHQMGTKHSEYEFRACRELVVKNMHCSCRRPRVRVPATVFGNSEPPVSAALENLMQPLPHSNKHEHFRRHFRFKPYILCCLKYIPSKHVLAHIHE